MSTDNQQPIDSKTDKWMCDNCAEEFKTEVDLEANLFNNNHCNPKLWTPKEGEIPTIPSWFQDWINDQSLKLHPNNDSFLYGIACRDSYRRLAPRIAQLEESLKEAESRSVCGWVKASKDLAFGEYFVRKWDDQRQQWYKGTLSFNANALVWFSGGAAMTVLRKELQMFEYLQEVPADQCNGRMDRLKEEKLQADPFLEYLTQEIAQWQQIVDRGYDRDYDADYANAVLCWLTAAKNKYVSLKSQVKK